MYQRSIQGLLDTLILINNNKELTQYKAYKFQNISYKTSLLRFRELEKYELIEQINSVLSKNIHRQIFWKLTNKGNLFLSYLLKHNELLNKTHFELLILFSKEETQ